MNDSKKITLLELKEKYTCGLCIPEIQRDYVMGAGGKDERGQDKLDKLLDAILEKAKENVDFDFSCIITYCGNPQSEPLEIYDGQQRLTTLLLMILYKLRIEKKDEDINDFNGWYKFKGRPRANEIIKLLTNNRLSIDEIEVTDFTSFSMKNLLETIKLSKYERITSEYLLNHVVFDMVSIGSQNEIEQFFMDLNSGVKLKDYELYKAKLTHRVNQIKEENTDNTKSEVLELWAHKMDNEWLDFFDIFADYEHPSEEYEVAFVKYCIKMVFVESREEAVDQQLESINADVIYKVYNIMQMIVGLNLAFYKKQEKSLTNGILYFSWGETDSDINKKWNYDKRGAFWKLDFEEYDRMLYLVIKFVLLDAKKSIELKDDILLWCFINTLDWQIDIQNEYLRFIKIVLNHNVIENKKAWYECQNKGQYLYYCKYCVYAIPQYYGEHLYNENLDNVTKSRHSDILKLNKLCIRKIKISNMLNRGKIAEELMKQIENILEENNINATIKEIASYREHVENYDSYVKKENTIFGIVEKMQSINIAMNKEQYYLECVDLSWPARGRKSEIDSCWVRLKCKTDFLFTEFYGYNHELVDRVKNKMGEEFVDKCFWINNLSTVKKIIDRETQESTTYNKKDSDSYWCEVWNFNNDKHYYESRQGWHELPW